MAATIGITHRFTLSSMDNATFNSIFVVEPVPEPGSVVLLGLGVLLLGGSWRGRRWRHG